MHPADDIWQTLIDGELPPAYAQTLREHRDGCAVCRQRYSELEEAQLERRTLLATLAAPVPELDVSVVIRSARARVPAWRPIAAAAAIVFILTAATLAAASPRLRQAIARAWHGLATTPRGSSTPARSAAGQASSQPVGIAIESDGPLQIAFEALQPGGEVRIALTEPAGKVTIVATQAVPYNVRSRTVDIRNTGTDATYDIVIPGNCPQATVLVAGDTVFVKDGRRVFTRGGSQVRPGTYAFPFSGLTAAHGGRR